MSAMFYQIRHYDDMKKIPEFFTILGLIIYTQVIHRWGDVDLILYIYPI
jgi:hypothetical protein